MDYMGYNETPMKGFNMYLAIVGIAGLFTTVVTLVQAFDIKKLRERIEVLESK